MISKFNTSIIVTIYFLHNSNKKYAFDRNTTTTILYLSPIMLA